MGCNEMSFKLHYSLAHATKVLNLVRKKMRGTPFDVSVGCWSNCREQGFHLARYTPGISDFALVFAQQRNSDCIVVVYGAHTDFDIGTNTPNEEVWKKNRKDLRTDEEAADYIAELLTFYPMKELSKP